jgi:hypothetical protein
MNRYSFGKIILCCGMAMAILTAYGVFWARAVDERFGDWAMFSIGGLGSGILYLLTLDFYRKTNPKITITTGIVGWFATLAILYHFYQHMLH